MIRQRAVLRNSSGSCGYHHDELSKQSVAAQLWDGRKPSIPPVNCYYFAVHWVCFLIVVYGVMLNHQKLYTSEECDMTWSRRQFLLLDLESNTTLDTPRSSIHEYPPSYRLFKFIDQRDVRYKSLQSKEVLRSPNSHMWCNPKSSNYNIPIVVYVPGHGGSYEQSRSLGAHGTQLSRRDYSGTTHEDLVNQKLHRRMISGDEGIPDLDDFFFDVYALDFGEEGGALHGYLVERQASYISDRINTLSAVCNVTQIHVVAHSMGGVSSRLALVQYPEFMKVVRNLITLGTPHNSPLWNWETTMFNIYNKLYKRSGTLKASIISISGGVRDEMIPPDSCYIVNERVGNSTISVLASSIMQPATIEGKTVAPLLGMDHRAIVWCHNVLSEVRSILYNLIHVNNITTQLKLSSPGFPDNYRESTTRLGHSMKVSSGNKGCFVFQEDFPVYSTFCTIVVRKCMVIGNQCS
jgi:pimeloyl-ACP methyl ester carboxylesterase